MHRRALFSLEAVAWSIGLLCASALLVFRVEASHAARAAQQLASPTVQTGAEARRASGDPGPDLATYDGVIGQLQIPALGLQVPILNNYDPDSLRRGVGRVRGTAVPGGLGNFVVAGHRDTYFRPLRHVSRGMTMHIVSNEGTYDYVIDSTSIVTPEDLDVLDVGDRPEMTLITCYPFDYIGAAPKRFIVHAHLVSVAGDTH